MRSFITVVIMVVALVCAIPAAWGQQPGNLVLSVPDWNQPAAYAVGGYGNWCSPTAAANVMGYWEDVNGATGLTDRQAFNASPAFPTTAGTWQQGLYHDGTVEMGWHMDTGGWQTVPRPFPPAAGSTTINKIGPGIVLYANTAYTDPAAAAIVKVAYPNTTVGIDTVNNPTMWANYVAEIDAARPAVVTFSSWVDTANPQASTTIVGFAQQTIERYPWDASYGTEHSVTGVGYIDVNPGFQNNGVDEWFVVHDNWGTTGQFVAVPLDSVWMQNDYVTNVPEPMTLALLGVGSVVMLVRRRR